MVVMNPFVSKLSAYFKGTYAVAIPIGLLTLLAKMAFESAPTFITYPLSMRALATCGYIIGFALDQWTTYNCFRLKSRFEAIESKWKLFEANIFLPNNPTLKQQLISIPTLAVVVLTIYVFLDPFVGFGGAAFHLWAAYDNHQLYREAREELEEVR